MSAWIYGIVLAELALVGIIDMKSKKISNFWILFNFILSIAFRFLFADYYVWGWESLVYPFAWIIIGFILFNLNIMGAGDSKFLASLYLVIPLNLHWNMLESLILVTIVVGMILLLLKAIINFRSLKAHILTGHWRGIRESIKSKFSFAPIIFLAWVLLGAKAWP